MLAGTAAALGILMLLAALLAFRHAIGTPERQYMDPLTSQLKLLWPLILFFAHYGGRFLSVESMEKARAELTRAGLYYLITPEQFFGWRLSVGLIMVVVGYLISLFAHVDVSLIVPVAAAFGFYVPALKAREARKRRQREIVRMLPTYLDFITMAVEAGLSLSAALVQAVRNGPKGALLDELERVNRDIKAGASRVGALKAMADRLDIREVSSLVTAIAQSERSGGSIGATLRVQADQRRIERFQRAEKLAMEAPVKLIFPLVAFIFPTTFVVLAFPIVMKFLHEM
jgi:tight adherence protein C